LKISSQNAWCAAAGLGVARIAAVTHPMSSVTILDARRSG
jgi:hypothetical protein